MAQVDAACQQWSRAEDAWAAVTWVLAHDPSVGLPLVEGGQLRALVYDGSFAHEMPAIYVLYEIADQEIVVREAHFRDAGTTAGTA